MSIDESEAEFLSLEHGPRRSWSRHNLLANKRGDLPPIPLYSIPGGRQRRAHLCMSPGCEEDEKRDTLLPFFSLRSRSKSHIGPYIGLLMCSLSPIQTKEWWLINPPPPKCSCHDEVTIELKQCCPCTPPPLHPGSPPLWVMIRQWCLKGSCGCYIFGGKTLLL